MTRSAAYPSVLLATLILAACGGGQSSDPTSASAASTTSTQEASTMVVSPASESEGASLAADAGTSNAGASEVEHAAEPAEFAESRSASEEAPAGSAPDVAPTGAQVSKASSTSLSKKTSSLAANTVTDPRPKTVVAAVTTTGSHLYVATTGSDSNPGTSTAPFKTILKASQVAKPGTTIHVASGTYLGGFKTSASGTSTARIRYVSSTKWGAKVIQSTSSTASTGWTNAGSYVDIDGFDIDGRDGASWKNGLASTGSYSVLMNNHVHNIATKVTCDSQGGSGINTNDWYYGYHIDVINNVVNNVGTTGCKYIQGIYASTSGKIKNNVVYNIGNWGIHLWHDARNLDIANNTVTKSGGGITVGGGGYYRLTGPADYVNVTNNIVYGNDKGIWEQGDNGSHNTFSNNLSYNNARSNYGLSTTTQTNGRTGDPQFVDYTNNNFKLKTTSPAIGYGMSTYAPSNDIVNVSRPQGGRDDIGAYEYVGADAR